MPKGKNGGGGGCDNGMKLLQWLDVDVLVDQLLLMLPVAWLEGETLRLLR